MPPFAARFVSRGGRDHVVASEGLVVLVAGPRFSRGNGSTRGAHHRTPVDSTWRARPRRAWTVPPTSVQPTFRVLMSASLTPAHEMKLSGLGFGIEEQF
jgi:hypothetical protein